MTQNQLTLDRPLALTGIGMLILLAAFAVGLIIDPRVVTGAPVWLKPAKFAASIAIYSFTLAWVFTYLADWPRTRRVVSVATTVVMWLEMAIIATQAWRGTTSHFNVGTLLDATLFSIMGTAIVVQTLTSIAVAVALVRQPFKDRALGWALRLGMVITIAGAFTGGLMTRPTSAQLEQVRAGGSMPIVGAHTVGAPDGGPGVPGTGWSREHGDIRVPHFVGLHALQMLPLMALLLRRRVGDEARTRLMMVAGGSYASLFGLLLWQALQGESLMRPDAGTLALLATWAVASMAAGLLFATAGRPQGRRWSRRMALLMSFDGGTHGRS